MLLDEKCMKHVQYWEGEINLEIKPIQKLEWKKIVILWTFEVIYNSSIIYHL